MVNYGNLTGVMVSTELPDCTKLIRESRVADDVRDTDVHAA